MFIVWAYFLVYWKGRCTRPIFLLKFKVFQEKLYKCGSLNARTIPGVSISFRPSLWQNEFRVFSTMLPSIFSRRSYHQQRDQEDTNEAAASPSRNSRHDYEDLLGKSEYKFSLFFVLFCFVSNVDGVGRFFEIFECHQIIVDEYFFFCTIYFICFLLFGILPMP